MPHPSQGEERAGVFSRAGRLCSLSAFLPSNWSMFLFLLPPGWCTESCPGTGHSSIFANSPSATYSLCECMCVSKHSARRRWRHPTNDKYISECWDMIKPARSSHMRGQKSGNASVLGAGLLPAGEIRHWAHRHSRAQWALQGVNRVVLTAPPVLSDWSSIPSSEELPQNQSRDAVPVSPWWNTPVAVAVPAPEAPQKRWEVGASAGVEQCRGFDSHSGLAMLSSTAIPPPALAEGPCTVGKLLLDCKEGKQGKGNECNSWEA